MRKHIFTTTKEHESNVRQKRTDMVKAITRGRLVHIKRRSKQLKWLTAGELSNCRERQISSWRV